jgi:hypothetical protein
MERKQQIEKYNFKNRTATEQREIAKQGGIASGEARRQKKTLKEIGDMIGSLAVSSEKNIAIMRQAGISDEDMVRDVEAMFRLSIKASSGDTRAIELLAKLRGQFKEVQSVEVAEVKPLVDLTKRKKNGDSKDDQPN